jgi:polysaccharide export outer membrane protein
VSLVFSLCVGCGTPQYTFPEAQSTNAAPATGSSPVSVSTNAAPTSLVPSSVQTADQIQPGVKLTIIFSGIPVPPPKHEEKVREDGYISPPLLGRVMAAGKTVGKLQEDLQNLYVPAYFTRALTVTVLIEERWFYVGGEVKNANRYIYSGEVTVLKAIQAAGDFTPFANRRKVKVIRGNGKTETVNYDKALKNPKLDLPVYPGDQVIVPIRLL